MPYKPRSKHPEAVRSRRRRRLLRAELIKILGGKCEKCGGVRRLEPHHKTPRTWVSRERWAMSRLLVYLKEARAGLLGLLCRDCNNSAGPPGAENNSDF